MTIYDQFIEALDDYLETQMEQMDKKTTRDAAEYLASVIKEMIRGEISIAKAPYKEREKLSVSRTSKTKSNRSVS